MRHYAIIISWARSWVQRKDQHAWVVAKWHNALYRNLSSPSPQLSIINSLTPWYSEAPWCCCLKIVCACTDTNGLNFEPIIVVHTHHSLPKLTAAALLELSCVECTMAMFSLHSNIDTTRLSKQAWQRTVYLVSRFARGSVACLAWPVITTMFVYTALLILSVQSGDSSAACS